MVVSGIGIGKSNSHPSATASTCVANTGPARSVAPVVDSGIGSSVSIDESMAHSPPSIVTIVVPWDGSPVSNIDATTRRESKPHAVASVCSALADGQHVPPTRWRSQCSKKSVASRPGSGPTSPPCNAISLRMLSKVTDRHQQR